MGGSTSDNFAFGEERALDCALTGRPEGKAGMPTPPIGGMSAPLEEGGREMPKTKERREWNEGSRPIWRAGHAPLDELEPDMEHDPTLAACCVRELSENRKNRQTMDALRAGSASSSHGCVYES